MDIVHNLEDYKPFWEGSSLTLGVFDGMHLGHQALTNKLQKRSRKGGKARVLVTYNPHPDLVLGKRKQANGTELYTYQEKLALFQSFDLDAVVFLKFTKELAQTTALKYLKDILIGKLRAKNIIIGYDQCFGKGRKGDYEFLKLMSKKYNYTVDRIKPVQFKQEVISSSRIRSEIRAGNIKNANKMLGHNFFVTGTVVRGFQRGKRIGYPTANLETPDTKIIPGEGVYTAVADLGGNLYKAMVNVGKNPTFENERLTIEAHILNFDSDLYGKSLRLHFHSKIRDEMKFEGPKQLTQQLDKDKQVTEKMPVIKPRNTIA